MSLDIIVPALSAIVVAVIEALAMRDRRRTARRAERRERESRLSMDLMSATCGLAMDTAKALRDGHTNGTLEGNLATAARARQAYDDFIKSEAAHAVAKL